MPLVLGQRRELFVDDFLIDSLSGDIRLHLHEPVPAEMALRLNKPWDGAFCSALTGLLPGTTAPVRRRFVMHDADLYALRFSTMP